MDELIAFINNSDLFIDIFLGIDPYINSYLKNLSAVCTFFTDVAYWQFADVFQRQTTSTTTSSPSITEKVKTEEPELLQHLRAVLFRSDPSSSISNHSINTETSSSVDGTNILQFDYVVSELANFISNSDMFQDIFLDIHSCTNNEKMDLNLVCTCFTDLLTGNLPLFLRIGLVLNHTALDPHQGPEAVPLLYRTHSYFTL